MASIILGKHKAIKKILGTHKTSIVYIEKMQAIQDLLTYAINQQQTTNMQIFINNWAAFQALKDPNKCFAPQIMQLIPPQLVTLKTQSKVIFFHWISFYKDIKRNKGADIVVKEATRWKIAKQKNGKWKE